MSRRSWFSNVPSEIAVMLFLTARGEQVQLGMFALDLTYGLNAGARIVQIVEAEFEEGVAVFVFAFRGSHPFGGRGQSDGNADARQRGRQGRHEDDLPLG